VVRSYVSEATTKAERTGAMAGISASQALGFILGPGELYFLWNSQHVARFCVGVQGGWRSSQFHYV